MSASAPLVLSLAQYWTGAHHRQPYRIAIPKMWRLAVKAAARIPRPRAGAGPAAWVGKLKGAVDGAKDTALKASARASELEESARSAAKGLQARAEAQATDLQAKAAEVEAAARDAAARTAARAAQVEAAARGLHAGTTARAAEVEAAARGLHADTAARAAEFEALARGIHAETTARAAELEAAARTLHADTASKAAEIEAAARDLHAGTSAHMEAKRADLEDRAADAQASLKTQADEAVADAHTHAQARLEQLEASKVQTLEQLYATKERAAARAAEVEASATAIAGRAMKELEGSRDKLMEEAAALQQRVGLAAAEEFASEQRAMIQMLQSQAAVLSAELARTSAAVSVGGSRDAAAPATPDLELLQMAALFEEHSEETPSRWLGWATQTPAYIVDSDLGRKLNEFIDLSDAIYEDCVVTSAASLEQERQAQPAPTAAVARWEAVAADPTSAPGRPAYALLLEKEKEGSGSSSSGGGGGRAVLAIRGTASMADVLTDVLAAGVEYGAHVAKAGSTDCEAHAGFVLGARRVVEAIKPALEEHVLGRRPLTVVGHSLGAGTAAVTTLELLAQYPDQFHTSACSSSHTGINSLECFAFACPPVFSSAVNVGCRGFVTSVVHSDDAVCRGSLHALVRLLNEVAGKDTASYTLALTQQASHSHVPWPTLLADIVAFRVCVCVCVCIHRVLWCRPNPHAYT